VTNVKITESWKNQLQPEFEKPYYEQLINFVNQEYTDKTCYPMRNHVFEAFNLCPFDKIKVVIIGQDPYHGEGQAHGLCFSVNDGVPHPPSLKNIFKEIQSDLNVTYPQVGNLKSWAEQGVLLLNATLTVRAHEAGSHQNKGWETFTDAVIATISEQAENVVFLLWGGYAKRKGRIIDANKHAILTCGHPSPLSANRGFWFGNKHFSKTNSYLENHGLNAIKWR